MLEYCLDCMEFVEDSLVTDCPHENVVMIKGRPPKVVPSKHELETLMKEKHVRKRPSPDEEAPFPAIEADYQPHSARLAKEEGIYIPPKTIQP